MKNKTVCVIGGGAAGMFAAVTAAENGAKVHLLEKNEKLGKKLFITGKGRCNITNNCGLEELFSAVLSNPKFLYSSFYGCTNQDVIRFFEDAGVATKVERGGRVFPVSDHSSDVIQGLLKELKRLGVVIHLQAEVKEIETADGHFSGVVLKDNSRIAGDACIIATGGYSYQTTGSDGDGYRFARELGHTVTELIPALVPMTAAENYIPLLQGLSLRNVSASIYDGKKELYHDFGEMLFTHYGVSGPLMLSASSVVAAKLRMKPLKLLIDLKPALSFEQLDQRLLRDFEENRNRQFKNALGKLLPAKLIPVAASIGPVDAEKKIHDVSREERQAFARFLKAFPVTLTGLRGFNEAIITKGGVKVKEVNPQTMESKKVPGIYFAGEVMDLDAVTGGFNLQIAWSTAHTAGINAAAFKE